jgi:hypothetical protein
MLVDSTDTTAVTLVSKDGKCLTVSLGAFKKIGIFREMADMSVISPSMQFPVHVVFSSILTLVID